jgi:carbon monoxide dehydrogenase subunit G
MALEISKSFVVRASPDAAWNLLTDPARVARCLPGAQITEKVDDRTYTGTITVKVGPVAASYKGTMKFEQLDPGARTAAITASGQDVRGKGGADMRMTSRLVERAPGETEVQITSQVNVMGILAQFGRGMIQDVSDQMFDKFVAAARAELETAELPQAPASAAEVPASGRFGEAGSVAEAPSPRPQAQEAAPPIEVLSFGSAVVGRAAGRAVKRPIVWVGIGVVLLVIFWIWRRAS